MGEEQIQRLLVPLRQHLRELLYLRSDVEVKAKPRMPELMLVATEPAYDPDDLDTPAYLRQGRLLN